MIDWLLPFVPLVKAVHIVGLCLWCGGLVALPFMLARHDPAVSQDDFRRIREATHFTYTLCVTPAAVVAVIAGAWLIFMRETFQPWFYAKLFFVMLLVGAHAWTGHMLVRVGETRGRFQPRAPYLPLFAVLAPVIGILVFVLGKPDLGWVQFPSVLLEPMGRSLPFDVPRL